MSILEMRLELSNLLKKSYLRTISFVIGCAAFLLILFAAPTTADAAVRNWDGGGVDNNWSTCANWSADTCPLSSDDVLFDATSSKAVTVDTNITVVNFTMNSGYAGTLTSGSNTMTTVGNFVQSGGTFNLSTATTTFKSNVTISGGVMNNNSGLTAFSVTSFSTYTLNVGTTTFYNVLFDNSQSGGGSPIYAFASNMDVAGNLSIQNPNNNNGTFTLRSDTSGTPRTISVAGNFADVSTTNTGVTNIGNTVDTFRIIFDIKGNLSLNDTNTVLYADVVFSSSSTQTISKVTNATVNLISDWSDTGAGNLALGTAFTGNMVFNIDDPTDFTFAPTTFALSVGNATITPAASYTPSGAATTTFTSFTMGAGSGTFNATASTTFTSLTINGGTFNAATGTTAMTGSFAFNGGTFNHNNGTFAFYNTSAVGAPNTLTPNSAVFYNVLFDYPVAVGANTSAQLTTDMTIAGNLTMQNINTSGGALTLQSNLATTTRTVSVGGNLIFPLTTSGTGSQNIGVSGGGNNILIDLKGNFSMDDTNSNLYADINFSSSSTQTITRTNGLINSASDWTDTGSGNLGLTANFSGSMRLMPDTATDFNFATTSFTFTVGSVTIATSTTFSPNGPSNYIFTTANIDVGTFNASVASTSFGALTISGGTFNAGSGTTTMTGNFTYTSGTFNGNSGAMYFVGPAAGTLTVTPGSAAFSNVIFDYTGSSGANSIISFASDMTVNGNFVSMNNNTSGGGFTLQSSLASTSRLISVAGNFLTPTTSVSSVVNISPSSGNPIAFDLKGNFQLIDSSVTVYADINFSSSSAQTITRTAGTINSASDWTDTGSGDFVLGSSITGSMKLFTDSTNDFNFATTSLTFTAGDLVIATSTSFSPAGPSSYSFTNATLTVGTLNASVASTSFGTLTIAGATFNAGSGTTTITSGFTYTSGTFNHNNGLIAFLGQASQTLTITPGSAIFNTVFFDYPSSSGANSIISFAGDMTVNGNFITQTTNSIGGGFTLQSSLSGTPRTITVAGDFLTPTTTASASVTIGGATTNRLTFNIAGNLTIVDSGAFINATTTFNGTSTQILTRTTGTISAPATIVVDKTSGEVRLGSALTSSSGLIIATGTFRTLGLNLTTASTTVNSAGIFQIQGIETLSATPTLATSSTFVYEGSALPSLIKNYSYKNLTIQATTSTLSLVATTTVAQDFNIISGTVSVGTTSQALSVGGNWLNNGTFIARSGTVTLTGTDQTIFGSTTFYNLSKSVSAPATLTFATTTQAIANTWNMSGASGNLLSFRSTNPGTQWRIDPQGTRTLSYIDVQDSNNLNVTPVNINGTMVNSGNNTNWNFDSVPPVATLTSTSTGTSTAIINWTTDEIASSSVQYGLTTSYGSSATSTGTTTHSVSLSGLSEGTLYHYKITSTDTSGNATSTADFVFTTGDGTPPTVSITSPSAGTYNGTISLAATTTDNVGVAGVKFYLNTTLIGSEDTSTPFTGSLNSTLFGDGAYTLTAVARDAVGNQATSTGVSLTLDNTAPVASSVASSTGTTTASITWNTNEAATSTVQYGLTTSYGSQATSSGTSTHSVSLSGLTEGTLYHFKVTSRDALGNSTSTTDFTFTTTDGTAPIVSNIASSTTYATSTITWNTNEAATSTVQYGLTTGYGSTATSSGTTSHSVILSSLTASTVYHYRIIARDASGNTSTSSDQIFTTAAAPDTTAPTISNIVATPGTSTASIVWNTNEAATSTVQYGLTVSYGLQATSSGTTSHAVSLSGLTDGVTYHYKVTAIDAFGNATSTADFTFNTTDGTAPTVSITAPAPSTVRQTIALAATTTDNIGVVGVKFYLNTTLIGSEDTSSPFTGSLDTTGFGDGSYSLRAVARDAAGNIATSSAVALTINNTAPAISSIASTTASTTASITWATDLAATSTVQYGLTTSYGSTATSSSTTTHSVSLSGLTQSTTYHFRVLARDAIGNSSTSSDQTFTTTDGSAPIISSIASSTTHTTSQITWNTDELANSKVVYGTASGNYTLSSSSASYVITGHTIVLSGLTPSTPYYFRVVSADVSNNISTSSEFIFTTTATPDLTVPTVSITAPAAGTVVGTIQVDANASDDIAVVGVAFYLNATLIGVEDTSSPYSVSLDTTGFADGSYVLLAVARDGSGNIATSTPVGITIANTPTPVPTPTPDAPVVINPSAVVSSYASTPSQSPEAILRMQQLQQEQRAEPNNIKRQVPEINIFKNIIPKAGIGMGDRGVQVRNLQKVLNALGFKIAEKGPGSPGNETDLFGPATKAALIRFQKAYGIQPASGYYGSLTRAKMLELFK